MPILILARHGRTAANASRILAGRTPGVSLDEVGREQVVRAAERISPLTLARVVSSPLERCQQTAAGLVGGANAAVMTEVGLTEVDYGDWSGRPLSDLAKEALWATVQGQPSAVVFPGGEAMSAMSARAVDAVRRHDREVAAEHGDSAVWLAVSHGDVIKAVLADALGMHLDSFQRISVGPASLSVVQYSDARTFVHSVNTVSGDLSGLAASSTPAGTGASTGAITGAITGAVVGGDTGSTS